MRNHNLHNLVQQIKVSFRRVFRIQSENLDFPDLDPLVVSLQDEEQRFDLWCQNLGAYQLGHASLEYRLRDAPKIYDYALRLLTDLKDNLALVQDEFDTKKENYSPKFDDDPGVDEDCENASDDDEEFIDSYNRKAITIVLSESIATTIDRLYRLSFKIRNPSTRFDLSRILNFKDFDEESNIDVLNCYSQFDLNHIKELILDLRYPKNAIPKATTDTEDVSDGTSTRCEAEAFHEPSDVGSIPQSDFDDLDSDFLVQRLAQANNIRRRQLRYWQTHQQKLAVVKPLRSVTVDPKHTIVGSTPAEVTAPSLATTEATKIKEEDVDFSDNRSVVSSATYALMQKEPGHSEVQIPPFPKWLEGKKEFQCPYCHIVCPGSMAKKSAWETHVLRDLRPYVCTIKDCREADQLFDTFQSWCLHENQAHDMKVTGYMDQWPYDSKGSQDYERPAANKIEEALGTNLAIDTRTCSFCLRSDVTTAHVGAHLQRIAIFALPSIRHSAEEDDTGDDDSNVALGSLHGPSSLSISDSRSDSDLSSAQEITTRRNDGELNTLRLDLLHSRKEDEANVKRRMMTTYLTSEKHVDEQSQTLDKEQVDADSSTPLDRIGFLTSELRSKWIPQVETLLFNPSTDPKEAERQNHELHEEISMSIFFPALRIDIDGDPIYKEALRELVDETRAMLKMIDEATVRTSVASRIEEEHLEEEHLEEVPSVDAFSDTLSPHQQVITSSLNLDRSSNQSGRPRIEVPFLSQDKFSEYSSLFDKAATETFTLSSDHVMQLFRQVGVPNEVLDQVWALVDPQGQGSLSKVKFVLAMHLLMSYKSGAIHDLPETLTLDSLKLALDDSILSDPEVYYSLASLDDTGYNSESQSQTTLQHLVAPSNATSSAGNWQIHPENRGRFDALFDVWAKGLNYMTREQAITSLVHKHLPQGVLAHILDIADIDSDGLLDRDEFAVAMSLVRVARAPGGRSIPQHLPPELIPLSKQRYLAKPNPTLDIPTRPLRPDQSDIIGPSNQSSEEEDGPVQGRIDNLKKTTQSSPNETADTLAVNSTRTPGLSRLRKTSRALWDKIRVPKSEPSKNEEKAHDDDPTLRRLTSMGWPRTEALAALEKFDYNIDKAVDYLISRE